MFIAENAEENPVTFENVIANMDLTKDLNTPALGLKMGLIAVSGSNLIIKNSTITSKYEGIIYYSIDNSPYQKYINPLHLNH